MIEKGLDGGLLDLAPGIHDDDALAGLGHDTEIMGDEDDRGAGARLELDEELQDLGLDGDVERGRRLVGDQEARIAGERHRDHHPLAHAAGELVRIIVEALLGIRNVHEAQHACGLLARRAPIGARMDAERLGDLLADAQERVEARHRLLEDHGDAVASDLTHRPLVERGEVLSFEEDRALDDACDLLRQEPHHRQGRDALAATGFADDAERLAGGDIEAHAVDRARHAIGIEEMRLEISNAEKLLAHFALTGVARGAGRGGRASRHRRG